MEASSRHLGFMQKKRPKPRCFYVFQKKCAKTIDICKDFVKNDGQLKNLEKPMVFDTCSSKTFKNPGQT